MFEQRQNALAIQRLPPRLEPGHLEEGRVKIHAHHRPRAGGARLHLAGPTHDHRHADAAFVQVPLRFPQWPTIAHAGEAPVVAGKNNQRVLSLTHIIQCFEQSADGSIHRLDHRAVARVIQAGPFAVLIFFQQRLGRLHWPVHGVKPQVRHPRLILFGADEFDRFIHQTVRQILTLRSVGKLGVAVRRKETGRTTVRRAADIHVEPLPRGRQLLRYTPTARHARGDVPFTEERIRVAGLLQPLGDGHVLRAELAGELGRLRALVFGEIQAG